jgi:hypothetical protein
VDEIMLMMIVYAYVSKMTNEIGYTNLAFKTWLEPLKCAKSRFLPEIPIFLKPLFQTLVIPILRPIYPKISPGSYSQDSKQKKRKHKKFEIYLYPHLSHHTISLVRGIQ